MNVIFSKRDKTDVSDRNASYTDYKNLIPNSVQHGESSGSFGNTVEDTSDNDGGIQSNVGDSKNNDFYAGTSKSDAVNTDMVCQHDHESQSLTCLLYTSPSPRDQRGSRMPSSA